MEKTDERSGNYIVRRSDAFFLKRRVIQNDAGNEGGISEIY